MLFNSIEFIFFLIITFLLYWFVFNRLKIQNFFLVLISYIFYGWWDWRFLILIAVTTIASYCSGILISSFRYKNNYEKNNHFNKSRIIAICNIILNLIILCAFKYFNFFGENLYKLLGLFGFNIDWITLKILLPVGISFYTFQALSYTIDVYKKKIEPTHDIISFFAYVSFFPQLVAGPIERATHLLPQFFRKRTFEYSQATDGAKQILWGLFKKIVVADNCAVIANSVFDNYTNESSPTLIIGAIMFTFQIYGDFSGYSDIAIGAAKLFGFNLMQNFNYPYFSRDIAEFWRRWHISLTTWFRDYIYIPLGGSREGKWTSLRNTMVIFIISGFWHGANWTFLIWGLFHALLFAPLILTGKNRKYLDSVAAGHWLPNFKEILQSIMTFSFVVIGWIIFRSETLLDAFEYLKRIAINNSYKISFLSRGTQNIVLYAIPFIGIIILIIGEWIASRKIESFYKVNNIISTLIIVILIFFLGAFKDQSQFIYFQF